MLMMWIISFRSGLVSVDPRNANRYSLLELGLIEDGSGGWNLWEKPNGNQRVFLKAANLELRKRSKVASWKEMREAYGPP